MVKFNLLESKKEIIKMKNYKLLAIAFAFLLLGQTNAVEQTNPQDDLYRAGKTYLKSIKKEMEENELPWTNDPLAHHFVALKLAQRKADGQNGIQDGSYDDLKALAKDESEEGVIAKGAIEEYQNNFSLLFDQQITNEKKFNTALKMVEDQTKKCYVDKSDESQKLLEKAEEHLNQQKWGIIKLVNHMGDRIKMIDQKKFDYPVFKQVYIGILKSEINRLLGGKFAPKNPMMMSPQDEGYDELLKLGTAFINID